jgi:hypothetical protein
MRNASETKPVNMRRMFVKRAVPASGVGIALVALLSGVALASSMIQPFTQASLDNDWEADRRFPTGGVVSTSAFGRDPVAKLGIDSSQTSAGTFTRTEGIKTVGAGDYGDTVSLDLYLDPDWDTTAVRAGLWVVGDVAGARDGTFGIIEFTHNEPCDPFGTCTSSTANMNGHEGFRTWDSVTGVWTDLATPFTYGSWVTLTITLDSGAGLYHYSIDGTPVDSSAGGGDFIREVFMNSYNYGDDEFPTLSNGSYYAHWFAGYLNPSSKADCKDNWAAYGFKNHGQCVKFIQTGKDSRS